jgi:uncharacterized protein YjbI with pentapeptide repeats
MANPEHLAKLKEGVEMWNRWRAEHSEIVNPDLREAPLYKADLRGADLREADLGDACLSRANLWETCLQMADLSGADLREADFRGADLGHANLSRANAWGAYLHSANLGGADLSETDLRNTDLTSTNLSMAICRRANFEGARLVGTNLEKVDLNGARVYGISAWDLRLRDSMQQNLVITPEGQPTITVDDLEVAQFIYLLLNNEHVRRVIDTITSKVVLILGRFTTERKTVLDAIREELRKRNYLPVLFDFEKPASKDLTGTISTLANMARFIIADLTDPSSVPHELAMVVPGTVVPVQPILLEGQREYAMFVDLKMRYHWVLEPYQYTSNELLITHLDDRVIAPAEAKAKEQARKEK